MTRFIGGGGWDCGPIVVASPALVEAWSKSFGPTEARALKNARAIEIMRFGDHEALVLGGGKETSWHPRPQALVRLGGNVVLGPQVKKAMAAMPSIDEKMWRVTNLSLTVKGGKGLVAFDGKAQQQVTRKRARRSFSLRRPQGSGRRAGTSTRRESAT